MTNEQRDNLLLSMANSLKNMNVSLNNVEKRIDNIEKRLDKLEEKIDNIEKRLDKLEKRIDNLEKRVDNLEKEIISLEKKMLNLEEIVNNLGEMQQLILKEIERQRMNIAKLEYDLTDQIKALFDISDIDKDKFKEHEENLKEIDSTLESHNIRLLKLEKTS